MCRPYERRLKNTIEFQKVMVEAEQSFRERQTTQTRLKRCVEVSPSVQQPLKSRVATTRTAPSARIALSFDSSTIQVSTSLIVMIYNCNDLQ